MTIQKALSIAYKKLKNTPASPRRPSFALAKRGERVEAGSDSSALDAEVLLSYALKKPKEYLITDHGSRITDHQARKFKQLIKKRLTGWPVAYLIGEKEFFGLKFFVTKDVLIPRPETESLIEIILKKINMTYFARPRILRSSLKILDLGTGSGCIIISLAKSLSTLPASSYFASDISPKALSIAEKNARRHKVKITFKQGDLLNPWKNQKFDIIVANLPYLTKLEDPSTKFEPKKALLAKKEGLNLIENLLKQIRTLSRLSATLPRRGRGKLNYIFLEFDPRQKTEIKKLAKRYLPELKAEIHKDLSGRNRFACFSSSLDHPESRFKATK